MLTTPGAMSSLTSTVSRTVPTREVTSAVPPSASPSRAASARLTTSVHSSRPFTRDGTLCIHELLLRRWRRPTTTKPSDGGAGACAIRRTSAAIGSGHSSIRPLTVRSSSGMRGCNGPRSTPCGLSLRYASVNSYGPVRNRRSSSRSVGVSPSSAATPARTRRRSTSASARADTSVSTGSPAATADSRSRISVSLTVPGSGGTTGGDQFAMLRTAKW